MSREVEGLKLENQVLRIFLDRHTLEWVNDEGWRQRRRNIPNKLTIEQKCEISNLEQERLVQEASDNKKASEKLADTLRAVLEETDIRAAELKKEAYEFKRDIVVGAENMRTGSTMAEKITRFMEEKLRQRDCMIEKLRLKNSTIKAQLQKVEVQLKQKEEMGDVLHYIDFHQLQIENKQHQSQIEQRNEELLRLKLTTGKTVQALNLFKQQLNSILLESLSLEQEILSRKEQLRKVHHGIESVTCEIAVELRGTKCPFQQQGGPGDLPSTLDYIEQKARMYELQCTLCNWERKVEIMEMGAKRARTLAHTQTGSPRGAA